MAATGIVIKNQSSWSPYLLLALFTALVLVVLSFLNPPSLASSGTHSLLAAGHKNSAHSIQKDTSPSFTSATTEVKPAVTKQTEEDFSKLDLMEVPDLASLPSFSQADFSQTEAAQNPWDFSDMGLENGGLSTFFRPGEPENVVYFDGASSQEHTSDSSAPVLFISSPEAVKKTENDRNQQARAAAASPTNSNSGTTLTTQSTSLPQNAFEIVWFHPGKRDDGSILKPVATDLLSALQGPDFSSEDFNYQDPEQMRSHLAKVLSLGMRGDILLKVRDNGVLRNEDGFDFALFENVMSVDSAKNVWQEFGEVGVSNSPDPKSFVWFQCDPKKGILQGCFGVVPTSMGGDKFDLSAVDISEVRYIWIRDLGLSKNFPSAWPTEGCDLDAIRLLHAYK